MGTLAEPRSIWAAASQSPTQPWYVCLVCLCVSVFLCFCVSVLLCLFVCVFVCLFACLRVCVFLCFCVSVLLRLFVCVFVCVFVCLYVCVLAWCSLKAFALVCEDHAVVTLAFLCSMLMTDSFCASLFVPCS
jgi:hypothetical protein